jgi:hypothetical protein
MGSTCTSPSEVILQEENVLNMVARFLLPIIVSAEEARQDQTNQNRKIRQFMATATSYSQFDSDIPIT